MRAHGDRFTDHREGLSPGITIGRDIIGNGPIHLVDLVLRHELVDLDSMRSMDRYRLQLIVGVFHVTAAADVLTLDKVPFVHRFTRDGVNLDVFDTIPVLLLSW